MSIVDLGVDAGVASGLVLMSGWSRSVRPFAAPQGGRSLLWYSLPKTDGRGGLWNVRWTAVRASGRSILNSGRSLGQRVAA